MTKSQKEVKEFMVAVGQEMPNKPSIPDYKTRELRVRLLLEEVLEFAEASGVAIATRCGDEFCDYFISDLTKLEFTDNNTIDLVEVADALADINYVSYGAANQYGLDLEPFEDMVHENNMTKLVDGYRDENGKFRKGPSYKPVDLKPILEAQLT